MTAPASSWLTDAVRRHLSDGIAPDPVSLREALEGRLEDRRDARGTRHVLVSLVSVLVAGVASGCRGALAVAQAAAGWPQDVLAAHGCRMSPRTGQYVAPSASTLDRLPRALDAAQFEAALTGALAAMALSRAVPAAAAARRQAELAAGPAGRRRRPPAAASFREDRADGWFRPHPLHPWLDPVTCGDPGHVPLRPAIAVDGKERRGARAGGNGKVLLLAAVTHVPGIVIAQDRVAGPAKAGEATCFRPLLEPLPLRDVLVTTDAIQVTRANAELLRKGKAAHYLWPVLGNQPGIHEALGSLPWGDVPAAAATSEISHGRIETRAIRVLPLPGGITMEGAQQAILIERHVTYRKKRQWRTRCEAVLYITSLGPDDATPEDLLAHIRGHWRVEHAHWLRDVTWNEDKSLQRTGNGPQLWSALTNLAISLFRIRGVTKYAAETRHCAQDPRHAADYVTQPSLWPA